MPFHTWAPDTYEGAPLPVTAFLSVASKAAGFVALILVIFLAFPTVDGVYGPLVWTLSALTMTVGNVIALRQTNIVRMLAYSSVSQGGFILMPLAFVGTDDVAEFGDEGRRRLPVDLRLHQPRRLRRRHRRHPHARTAGGSRRSPACSPTAPALTVLMTVFLASLAGVPPLGGWIAKFSVFRAVLDAGNPAAYIARRHRGGEHRDRRRLLPPGHAHDVDGPGARSTPRGVVTPPPVMAALGITAVGTVVLGVLPGLVMRFADLQDLTGAFGS